MGSWVHGFMGLLGFAYGASFIGLITSLFPSYDIR